jgi:hypothetical protein
MNRSRLFLGVAVAGGVAVAALAPGSLAVGQQSPPVAVVDVELQDTGQLQSRGAVALVTVQLTCTPGLEAFVSVELTQRSGGRIARGFGEATSPCDGTIQDIQIPVSAFDAPFKQGPAFADAAATVCVVDQGCATDEDAEEIRLTKRA